MSDQLEENEKDEYCGDVEHTSGGGLTDWARYSEDNDYDDYDEDDDPYYEYSEYGFSRCSVCKRPDMLFGKPVGNHKNCCPF